MDDDGFLDDLLNDNVTPARAEWKQPSYTSMEMDKWDDEEDKKFDLGDASVEQDLDDLFGDAPSRRVHFDPSPKPRSPPTRITTPEPTRIVIPSSPEPTRIVIPPSPEPVRVKIEPKPEPEPEPEPVKIEPVPVKIEPEVVKPKPKPKPKSAKPLDLKRPARVAVKNSKSVPNGCTCQGNGTCEECTGGL